MAMLLSLGAFAQDQEQETMQPNQSESTQSEPTSGVWTRGGNISLLFNQAAFNKDWTGGGSNNYGGNLTINYDANYKAGDWTWDNKFLFDYGINKISGQDSRKTTDRLSLNSLLGKQATETWYFSFFVNFQTQIARGYDYDATPKLLKTKFMAPGYLSFGPGMLWKKSDNLKVNISPATARIVFSSREFTDKGAHFGVEKGKTSRFEFGASVNAFARLTLCENITMENTLALYSNYLDKPQNVDIDYTLGLVMKVNDFISANFVFQSIYDHDAVKAFQIRENFGAGFTYKF